MPATWPRSMLDPLPPLSETLANFRHERVKIAAFLSTLVHEVWQHPAYHATLGATTLRKQVQGLIAHDEDRMRQVVEIRELVGRR